MVTYIISREQYSERAGHLYPSHPYSWPVIGVHRSPLPRDEESFHNFILGMLGAKGYREGRHGILAKAKPFPISLGSDNRIGKPTLIGTDREEDSTSIGET